MFSAADSSIGFSFVFIILRNKGAVIVGGAYASAGGSRAGGAYTRAGGDGVCVCVCVCVCRTGPCGGVVRYVLAHCKRVCVVRVCGFGFGTVRILVRVEWELSGSCVGVVWELCGSCVGVVWEMCSRERDCGGSVGAIQEFVWELSGSLCGSCVGVVWELCGS